MAKRIKDVNKEIDLIKNDVETMKEKLIEKRPSHFSRKDIVNALFATLIICISFIMSGGFVKIALNLSISHIIVIILATIAVLSIEIYFIAYVRVKNKRTRLFWQFYIKRMISLYGVGLFVSLFIIYLFGVNSNAANMMDIAKMVFLLALPSSIGGAIPSLIRQY